jgi:hypothetical protein
MNQKSEKCMCVGGCMQFEIWEGKKEPSFKPNLYSLRENYHTQICQATRHSITKTKPIKR